ncbi:hypothetical protein [Nocardia sp. NPDC057440]
MADVLARRFFRRTTTAEARITCTYDGRRYEDGTITGAIRRMG